MPSENRPAPAVGQLWMDKDGRLFLIGRHVIGCDDETEDRFSATYEDGETFGGMLNPINDTDTYVGQFRGFKVEGCNAN